MNHRRDDEERRDTDKRLLSPEFRAHLLSLGVNPDDEEQIQEYRAMLRFSLRYFRGGKKMGVWFFRGLAGMAGAWGFLEALRRFGVTTGG